MDLADITDYPVSECLALDNKKIPENFLSFFKTKDCASSDCAECGFCELIARKAITVDGKPLAELVGRYEALLDSLVSGDIYAEDGPEPEGLKWDADAEKAHGELVEFVPKIFRSAARKKVLAEIAKRAGANGNGAVKKSDVFAAWLAATPGMFRKNVEEKVRELSKA